MEVFLKLVQRRKVYLYPRFHMHVSACLDTVKPDLVQINVKLTPLMVKIQSKLVELANVCIQVQAMRCCMHRQSPRKHHTLMYL